MKRTRILAIAFVAILATLAIASDDSEKEMVDGTAAFVNGETLTVSDVMINAVFMLRDPQWVGDRDPDEALRAAYKESLEQLIDQKLIIAQYQRGDARFPPWIVDKRISEIVDSRFDGDRSKLLRELSQQHITFEHWRSRIENQIIVMAMRQNYIDANVHINPAAIQEFYEKNPNHFQAQPEMDISMFHVAQREGDDPEALTQLVNIAVNRLKEGEDFGAVGREYDKTLRNDGAWGWINPEESLRDDLVTLLDGMDVGAVEPLRTDTGYFVVKKNAERPGGTKKFEDVRSNIENFLFEQEAQRLYQEWIAKLRRDTKVKVFDTFPK